MAIEKRVYREELWNTSTHAFGLVLSVIGLVLLLIKGIALSSDRYLLSVTIFGLSLVFVYGSSTVYHWAKDPKRKRLLKTIDHVAIYFLIAGTYTPFTLVTLQRGPGPSMLAAIWSIAIIGTIFKLFFTGRFNLISTLLYVAMGWLSVLVIKPLIASMDWNGFVLLAAGGVVYTLGVIFYLAERLPYNHAIWHFFVIGGSLLHFLSIFLYVKPVLR